MTGDLLDPPTTCRRRSFAISSSSPSSRSAIPATRSCCCVLTDAAGGPKFIPLLWATLHVIKTAASIIGGSASDRLGRRTLIAGGWLVYALVYCGFAFSASLPALITWFMIYGVYYGCVEGTERALIADFAPPSRKGDGVRRLQRRGRHRRARVERRVRRVMEDVRRAGGVCVGRRARGGRRDAAFRARTGPSS